MMVTIYILKCKEDKYYVGKIADNVWKRIKQHFDGKGAKWTKRYQPIDIIDVRRGLTDRDESKVTIDLMKVFGIHNVRGGAYTKMKLDKDQNEHLEYRLGISDRKPQNRLFEKNAKQSNFRRVLLPLDTAPVKVCRAMKKNGKGRCRKEVIHPNQLCHTHHRQGKNWREISEEELAAGEPISKPKSSKQVKLPNPKLWPKENENGITEQVTRKSAQKIRMHGQCRGSVKSGRRCKMPCEKNQETCKTHKSQR